MSSLIRRAALTVALVSLASASAYAATQMVKGKKFAVKSSSSTDPTKPKVTGQALEKPTDDTLVGDPTANGDSTLRVIVNGPSHNYDQTFTLKQVGWRKISTLGFQYSNSVAGGAVKKASIKKTPAGVFSIKTSIQGKYGAVNVFPPNPSDDGGFILTLAGGDS